jgi:uncharacterized protein YjbI with pentapeptide repeats
MEIKKLQELIDSKSSKNTKLAITIAKSNKIDLGQLNFSGADLSDCDLRAFNFRGMDLSDIFGVDK